MVDNFSFIRANNSDIEEIIKLNEKYIRKFKTVSRKDIKKEIELIRKMVEENINDYLVIVFNGKAAGYLLESRNGNSVTFEDLQLYPEYDCREVILKVLYSGRCAVKDYGALYISNVAMSDKNRIRTYEQDEFKFHKMINDNKGMYIWMWYEKWWM